MKLPKELREKSELKGALKKPKKCSIIGCSNEAIRSLNQNSWKKYVEKAGLKFIENRQKKLYLCKVHYKEANKYRKSQEKLYQKKGFLDNSVSLGKIKRYD